MIKKLSALTASAGYLLATATAFAQSQARNATIPANTLPGPDPRNIGVGGIITNAVQIVFIAAILAVLIYLVIGAFKWITSGGDKDAIGKARGTIVNALIGLAILSLAFFITVLFGEIVGINIFSDFTIPTLGQTPVRLPGSNP